MKTFLCWISGMCLMLAGCGLDGPAPHASKHEETAATNQPSEQKPSENAAPEKSDGRGRPRRAENPAISNGEKTEPEKSAGSAASQEKAPVETKPGTEREKAAVGVGEKGRGYGGGVAGVITTSVHVLFTAREKIYFDQMTKGLNDYRAEHDGHPPKTEAEFYEKIIKEYRIQLPALPYGERYVYDPEKGDLMVERKVNP